ncbi:MAG: STAS domain-containing protein [Gammaproteobacteria bacterium]|nr:STAS domain-containing protein [Gammaproteobacteria bacterium]
MNAKETMLSQPLRDVNSAGNCGGCYLRHGNVSDASSPCSYCFSGKILAPDTLILPPVWTGLNALSVFSAMQKLPRQGLQNGTLKIDFTQVEFLDSSGLGALVALQKQLVVNNVVIHIIGADAHARRLFRTANLDQMFVIN